MNKIIVAKLCKYMILFKDILTLLGIDYRDASIKILYLVVLGILVPINQIVPSCQVFNKYNYSYLFLN